MTKKTTEQAFRELQNPRRSSQYDVNRDRYDNIGSTSAPRTKRAAGSEEYPTKGGYEINASKIVKLPMSSTTEKFSIIATQCPMSYTLDSFWDLVFTGKADNVVALGPVTPGRLMNYWDLSSWEAGYAHPGRKYSIEVKNESPKYGASCRKITIIKKENNSKKEIQHYHYAAWPDHDVPSNLNDFEKFVNSFGNKGRKIIVHCSAGIGRTGTFAGCLYALRSGQSDPKKIVEDMRKYRSWMVQQENQFDILCKYIIRNCIDPNEIKAKGLEVPNWGDRIDYDNYFSTLTKER